MKERTATEQLLTSDAVDRSIAQLDFRALSGEKVFFDTKYIEGIKGPGVMSSNYIISAMRQQLIAANCLLQDKAEDADYIVEARIGALGADQHELVYGVPANHALSTAVSIMPGTPNNLPAIPEISIAKKNDHLAAAKLAVFAYDRNTRERVWQSGVSEVRSHAKDFWILGAGPFQRGEIHQGTQLAGEKFSLPVFNKDKEIERDPLISYHDEVLFKKTRAVFENPELRIVNQQDEDLEISPPQLAAPQPETAPAQQ